MFVCRYHVMVIGAHATNLFSLSVAHLNQAFLPARYQQETETLMKHDWHRQVKQHLVQVLECSGLTDITISMLNLMAKGMDDSVVCWRLYVVKKIYMK